LRWPKLARSPPQPAPNACAQSSGKVNSVTLCSRVTQEPRARGRNNTHPSLRSSLPLGQGPGEGERQKEDSPETEECTGHCDQGLVMSLPTADV
jgi:hypothetical protein